MLKFNQEKKDFDETIEDLNTSYVKVQSSQAEDGGISI